MAKVVYLNAPSRRQSDSDRKAALLSCFAQHRRTGDDVFWLKENAELLNILECTSDAPLAGALTVHEEFHAQIDKRLTFFPQYYRFLLSILLDLEDLGMSGDMGERLVNRVADQGLAKTELSDLQRGEARRLMLRRGRDPLPDDPGLTDRLRRFTARSATFAVPNKKAAYELTHVVFYLSEYGRCDPNLPAETLQSLDFAGTLAFLDQDADLLAEICIAMRFARISPPDHWRDWLVRHTRLFTVSEGPSCPAQDNYHEYFVCNWWLAMIGHTPFANRLRPGRMTFVRPQTHPGALRQISESLYRLDTARSSDWEAMRSTFQATLSESAHALLLQAESASHCFSEFYSKFSRAIQSPARAGT